MKAYFVERAIRLSAESLASELFDVPYEPYAPVRQQMLNIVRLVNDARRKAGLRPLDFDVLRYRRRIVKPFDWPDDRAVAQRLSVLGGSKRCTTSADPIDTLVE